MRLFQLVRDRTAEAILKDGFQDVPYPDRTEDGQVLEGVRLFDNSEGCKPEEGGVDVVGGSILLAIEIPEDVLSGHELAESNKYREQHPPTNSGVPASQRVPRSIANPASGWRTPDQKPPDEIEMEDEPGIREFLVPASLVNSFGPPKIADVELNWPGLLDDIYTDDIGEDPE